MSLGREKNFIIINFYTHTYSRAHTPHTQIHTYRYIYIYNKFSITSWFFEALSLNACSFDKVQIKQQKSPKCQFQVKTAFSK